MYGYKSARCISDWTESTRVAGQNKLRGEIESKIEPFVDWQAWTGKPGVGTYHCEDLAFARKQLLESGRSPKVTMRNLHETGSLRYECIEIIDGRKGSCVIRETPPYSDHIISWLGKLGDPVEYCGERLPGITLKCYRDYSRSADEHRK